MFDSLNFSKFRITFYPEETLLVPEYKGSMLRGALGYALRKVACPLKRLECIECQLNQKCAYSICFETPIPQDAQIMKNDTKAPHPFILEPPLEPKNRYEIGEPFACTLTLVGKAQEYLPHFICALILMGERGFSKDRGKAKLISLENLTKDQSWKTIYDSETGRYIGKPYIHTVEDIQRKVDEIKDSDCYEISYLTPTRIKIKDKFAEDGELKTIVVHLIRRLTTLQYFFCDGEIRKDLNYIIEMARNQTSVNSEFKWKRWVRYSSRQRQRLSMGGFIGKVVYNRLPVELLELLVWGENLHIGKGTVFGMGKYRVIPLK